MPIGDYSPGNPYLGTPYGGLADVWEADYRRAGAPVPLNVSTLMKAHGQRQLVRAWPQQTTVIVTQGAIDRAVYPGKGKKMNKKEMARQISNQSAAINGLLTRVATLEDKVTECPTCHICGKQDFAANLIVFDTYAYNQLALKAGRVQKEDETWGFYRQYGSDTIHVHQDCLGCTRSDDGTGWNVKAKAKAKKRKK